MACSVIREDTHILSFRYTTPLRPLHLSAYNMTASVGILIACFFVSTNSVENIYTDNGWRPMSNEKVFDLQRHFIKTPIQSIGNTMANVYQRRNAIKIVDPNSIHLNKVSIKAHEATLPLQGAERNGRAFKDTTEPPIEEILEKEHIKSNSPRKAKKVEESDVILVTRNAIHSPIHNNADTKPTSEIKNKKDTPQNHTYQVYERSTQDNLLTEEDDLKPLNTNGYSYEIPKVPTKVNNTLTAKLFNILANYNIRSGDKLPNYALSLRQNSRNSNDQDFVYMQIPIKIPLRYNSPNHYPIDPLLAVFLSNYGHYLPGLYGFQRNYNNLYGYLASNNIHNNNPIGSYKIFSDTDSAH